MLIFYGTYVRILITLGSYYRMVDQVKSVVEDFDFANHSEAGGGCSKPNSFGSPYPKERSHALSGLS